MRIHLWRGYLIGVVGLAVGHATLTDPTRLDLTWTLVAWSSVLATIAGIAVHRPIRPGPWWLTAAGLAATAAASMVAPASIELAEGTTRAMAGDALHLGSYVMIGVAVVWFARLQAHGADREAAVDAAIVALALASVLWSIVIDRQALGADLDLSSRMVAVVAPILPAGVTALCVRLMLAAGPRLTSARLLGGAWILAFLGSISWVVLLEAGAYSPGGPADLLWFAALGCAGASALHPSMARLGEPTRQTLRTESRGRTVVLGIALLATPAALLLGTGTPAIDVVAPVAGSGLIALLVLGRLTRLVHDREEARAALEIHALRQEAIAQIGSSALGDRSTDDLLAEAAALATVALDGLAVTIHDPSDARDPADHPRPTYGRVPLVELAITDGDRTFAVLEAASEGRRTLRHEEHAFLVSVTAVLSSMVARRSAEDDLRRLAHHDDLTGLPNRVLLLDRLERAVAQRDRGPVGVLFVDLDGFKAVNDAYGHAAGDALLATVAQRLAEMVRVGDTIGRLAGDEFIVVAPDCDRVELADLAARLLAVIAQPVALGEALIGVTASVGAAVATDADRDPAEVLRRADAAMYAAKEGDGIPIAFADEATTPSSTNVRRVSH